MNGVQSKTELLVTVLNEIPPGEGRTFEIKGKQVAIFHSRKGEVFATQAICPHKAGPLSDGLMGDATVLCPLHSWKFDLRTGEAIVGACSLQTYGARLDDNGCIYVLL